MNKKRRENGKRRKSSGGEMLEKSRKNKIRK